MDKKKRDLIKDLCVNARDKKWNNEKIELEIYKANEKLMKSNESKKGLFENLLG